MTKMREYLKTLRNVGIIAHIDAGKTTLSERILFYTKKIHRMGEVHEGAATMDFMPEEQERGITIASACCSCTWRMPEGACGINLIDTPGHVDFSIEVERCLRVLDGCVGVFCAVGGVEPQSETVWRQAEKFRIPKVAFINKMDRLGASFSNVLQEMHEKLEARPVALVVPLGEGEQFEALLDVVTLERMDFDVSTQGVQYSRQALSAAEAGLIAPWRELLLNSLADESDEIMERYLSAQELPAELLHQVIRRATLKRSLVPVFAGAALRNAGVQPLLDGICRYLPNPLEAEAQVAEIKKPGSSGTKTVLPFPEAPLSALVFKLFMEGGRKLSLLRIYAGTIHEGKDCLNVTRAQPEKITRIFRLNADEREQIPEAGAGDIVAVQGIRSAHTGDSIAEPGEPLLLENISAYHPVISLALEPHNSGDGEKLDELLRRFLLEDPTLRAELDEETGQRIVSGMGELHLEILLEKIKREGSLVLRIGNPQVLCRETVLKKAEAGGEFDRELGDVRHYGQVTLRVAPQIRGCGNLVQWSAEFMELNPQNFQRAAPQAGRAPRPKIGSKIWPQNWLDEVERGIEDSLQSGVLQGFPVQDVLVEILSLQRKEGFSSPAGYHMAAVAALKSALESARPVLLEPVMYVEISTPEAFLGAAFNLVSAHGGKVIDMRERSGYRIIKALAPMRELFGFSTYLRSSTQGRAGLLMRFERFDVV
ncbi:MAG: elongation factor G [Deltaproteobacteria bacterium]|jgi:elongation factor G|nr:elongation factor G [Deltaproteobacteria bacterium]